MRSFRLAPAFVFLCGFAILAACGDQPTASRANLSTPPTNRPFGESSNPARTNVEELGLLVNVPYDAEDVVWKEFKDNGTLLAVIKFKSEDAAKVVADAEKFGPSQPAVISPEDWFPEELTAQSEMSGDNQLKGLSYPANALLGEAYKTGRITRIDGTDFFVLEASTP
ncbi:MAG: hypothetical protein AB7J13_03820 [Pyrinomonadaceae bacterium]